MLKKLIALIWPRVFWSAATGEIDWSVSNVDVSLLPRCSACPHGKPRARN